MPMCPGERGTHCRGCGRSWRERLRAYERCSGGGVAETKIGSRRARLPLVVARGGLTRLVGRRGRCGSSGMLILTVLRLESGWQNG